MGPTVTSYAIMEVISPPPSSPNFFQIIGLVGGLLGVVALLSLPWTIRKLRAETNSIEVDTEGNMSERAVKHLQVALEEADKTIKRLREDTASLQQQVTQLGKTLEEERKSSERERELLERRVVSLMYEIHAKDVELSTLRQKGS